jgi:hypothetical protein
MAFTPMTETDEVLCHESFDDAARKAVCDAYNGAWLLLLTEGDTLANTKRYPDAQRLLARRIINAARMGMRDVTSLRLEGISYLRNSLMPNWPREG